MQIQFTKEGTRNYMVVPWQGQWQDGYEGNLFQYLSAPCFLQYEVRQLDGKVYLYYRLQYHTGLQSGLGSVPLTYERVCAMIGSIMDAVDLSEEYLIEPEKIIWDSNCIFMDVSTGKLQFCYYPGDTTKHGTIRTFVTELIQQTDKKQDNVVLLLMGFYNVITEETMMEHSFSNFRKKMGLNAGKPDNREITPLSVNLDIDETEEMEQETTSGKKRVLSGKSLLNGLTGIVAVADFVLLMGLAANRIPMSCIYYLFAGLIILIILTIFHLQGNPEESVDTIMQEYLEQNPVVKRNEPVCDSEEIGETTVLSERTVEVCEEPCPKNGLSMAALEQGKYPEITLEKGSVVIGSMEEGCTYVLKESGVSRLHAKIMEKGDGMYLLDLNSTNGTYLNGELLEAGEDYKLEQGDLVAFAKCEFYVK